MSNRRPKVPPLPVDRVAALRAAVDALLGESYPGCRHAAFSFCPGPGCPPVVVAMRGDPSKIASEDAPFGPRGNRVATFIDAEDLAAELADE